MGKSKKSKEITVSVKGLNQIGKEVLIDAKYHFSGKTKMCHEGSSKLGDSSWHPYMN